MSSFTPKPENRKLLIGILLVALALRIGSLVFFQPPLTSDDKDYDAIARSIAHGGGYALDNKPTAFRAPGYPLLLAVSYAVLGDLQTPIRMLQVIADLFSCLLVFSIGKKAFTEKVGLAAAAGTRSVPDTGIVCFPSDDRNDLHNSAAADHLAGRP